MAFTRTMHSNQIKSAGHAYYFIFSTGGRLMIPQNADTGIEIPLRPASFIGEGNFNHCSFLGFYNDRPCYTGTWGDTMLPEEFEWANLRGIVNRVDYEIWEIIGYARQINDCHVNAAFCGKCGKKTVAKSDEQARVCPNCHLTFYPRISPAIITAVTKGDKILLARGVNFPNKKMFSVLAGFVDAQERLEDCVIREVYEETGIRVKNVTYFDSQPWPFPDSLMIGFTAEYESGSIRIDPDEIAEANWFRADELPLVPGRPTLSGALIQWFVENCKK